MKRDIEKLEKRIVREKDTSIYYYANNTIFLDSKNHHKTKELH